MLKISALRKSTSSKPFFYKSELDVIRFIAFLSVFLHHIFPSDESKYIGHVPEIVAKILAAIANSFGFGLSLFFFLSAYLISTLLMIEHRDFGSIDLKSFYIRRILRIWPLYFTGILVGVAYAWRYHPEQLSMFKWYVLFIGNFYYQNHPWNGSPMDPLWSISVEEQFYVIFPVLMGILGTVWIPRLGIGFTVVSIAALIVESLLHVSGNAIWTNTLSEFIFFGAGILCSVYTIKNGVKIKPLTRVFFLLGAFVIFVCSTYFAFMEREGASNALMIVGYVGAAVGCVLILFSFLNAEVQFPKSILFLGKISYGLYVWHMLNFYILGHFFKHTTLLKPLTLFPTIMMAIISYRYLETPFLRLKSKFTYIGNRPA
jgi:peptidoglycan/LPS O-acetylase OafA/YrhL